MNATHWERVQVLFERALGLPPEARAALLDDLSRGDPDLAGDVAGLLAAHERSGDPSIPTLWLGSLREVEEHRFTPGDRVADRYDIRGLLGSGGMSEVYEAWDSGLSIVVALKILRTSSGTDESYRRLKLEGFLARSIWHPNVCRLYDLGRHDDERGTTWFLTMERLQGTTLASRLREGRLDPEDAQRIAEQVAAALGAAHKAGVVHRDFKPGNVMLVWRDGEEQAVVTDFGISRLFTDAESQGANHGVDPAAGTPAYMAPEQARGEPAGIAADMYALGVVLHEMVTGQLPKREEPSLGEPAPNPALRRDLASGLDERWGAVIRRCMEPDPTRRFRTPEEVAAALTGRAGELQEAPAESRTSYSLPAERDDFVGRQSELDTLDSLFAGGSRLVTLVGAAGMGKTRLSIRYAWRNLAAWPGGTWFCDLKDAHDGNGIASAVARILGIPLGRQDPLEQLAQVIAGRGRCLLILDNFEQVVDHAVGSVGLWLERTNACFLATSRERLGLGTTERLQRLEPLAPEAALELFAARVRWLRPGLEFRGDEVASARDIVRLVDFMPLAIELAAARVRVMTIRQILAQMRDRFRLLTGGRTDRHETLEVAIDASWDILNPWERDAWAQCSVFEGGFNIEAAEHVLDLGAHADAPGVLDVVQSLTDRSLIGRVAGLGPTAAPSAGPDVRFGTYASLQEYAHRKLAERGGDEGDRRVAAERRHGEWYSLYGTDESIVLLDRSGGTERRRMIDRDLTNLVVASRRAIRRGDGPVAVATYRAAVEVLLMRGPFATALELGREILAQVDLSDREKIWVLMALSRVERVAGTREAGRAHAEEALALARGTSDRRLAALAVGWLGNVDYDDGATDTARLHYEEALGVHREYGDHGRAGVMLAGLGLVEYTRGNYENASSLFRSALDLLIEAGDRRREAYVHGYLGALYRNWGRFDEALAEHTAALPILREVGERSFESLTVGNLGNLYTNMRRFDEARACYESVVAMTREMGDRRNEGLFLSNLGSLLIEQGRLEEARPCVASAVSILRVVGTRMYEGYALSLMGKVSYRQGNIEAARRELVEAEAVLREADNQVEVAKVLCLRGKLELDACNVAAAKTTLNEVESLAAARAWSSEGELGRLIGDLREMVAGHERGALRTVDDE